MENKLLDHFRMMAIAAHCLHTGQATQKTAFEELHRCGYGFCRERFDLCMSAPADHATRVAVLEVERLTKLIDTPHTADFMQAVPLEAAHQIKRWGTKHDTGKEPQDWFWLVGYLAGKALRAAIDGDIEKAKHHTISTAAVMLNWHRRLSGDELSFQPGAQESAYCYCTLFPGPHSHGLVDPINARANASL